MFDIFFTSDLIMMQFGIYLLLFLILVSFGFVVAYQKARNVRFLVIGNAAFLLMHISVVINIQFNITTTLFVAMFNLIGMGAYIRSIAEIFQIEIRKRRYLIVNLVHFCLILLLMSISNQISILRVATSLAVLALLTLFFIDKRKSQFQCKSFDDNTVALLIVLPLVHLGQMGIFIYEAFRETTIQDIALDITILTFLTLMLIIWINFSLFIASYHVLYNRYRHLSYHDELTEIPNRRHMNEEIKRHIELVQRGLMNFGLISIDLDGFKTINDTYGHVIGDELLQEFARVLQSVPRHSDHVARMGGDEFMILVHMQQDDQEVNRVVERLIETTKNQTFTRHKLQISFTAGSMIITKENKDIEIETLLMKLDERLYQKKNQKLSK